MHNQSKPSRVSGGLCPNFDSLTEFPELTRGGHANRDYVADAPSNSLINVPSNFVKPAAVGLSEGVQSVADPSVFVSSVSSAAARPFVFSSSQSADSGTEGAMQCPAVGAGRPADAIDSSQ